MPRPDREKVIERLQALLLRIPVLEGLGSDFYRTADFSNWQSDVESWLRAGSPHTDDQCSDFQNLRFEPISYTADRKDAEARWRRDLKKAQHSIERAIENIDQDWTPPRLANTDTATDPPRSGPTFVNFNIQHTSLTVRAALEEIAREIEEKDQAEGKSFKKKIEKWAENPAIKTVLEALLNAALKHIP